jgi:hypothetical protein
VAQPYASGSGDLRQSGDETSSLAKPWLLQGIQSIRRTGRDYEIREMQPGATENARKSDAVLKVYLLELNMQDALKDSGRSTRKG